MTPYYEKDGIVIYHGDCREILPTLGPVDLVLTDPPYGISYFTTGRLREYRRDKAFTGDKDFNDPSFLFSCGEYHIIWGANNWCSKMPDFSGWLVWYKNTNQEQNGKWPQSDAELAWTNVTKKVLVYQHTWQGCIRPHPDENGRRLPHPTQKPIMLMLWCINLAADSVTIFDPFMGSGTTLVAAKQLGRKAIGIEIEEKYCEIAVERLRQGVLGFRE